MWLKSMFLAAALLSLCGRSTASCQTEEPALFEITEAGRNVSYCTYEGIFLLPGSVVRNKDKCEEATCTETTFKICGIGIKAGSLLFPPGCTAVPNGCELAFTCNSTT